jgi:hypothetical protein
MMRRYPAYTLRQLRGESATLLRMERLVSMFEPDQADSTDE